jgi:uncharacterized protein (TIGR03382 family)
VVVQTPDEDVMYLVDVAGDAGFTDARTAHVLGWQSNAGTTDVSVGTGPCGGPLEIDGSDRFVRVRAVDAAGNISVISAGERAGGCSSLPSPLAPSALLVLLLAGLARRRR